MEKTIQNNLCKGIRACGIPQAEAHTILNIITKWYDCSGPEWTMGRIKSLRQWYETCLAGEPKPPEWFKHSKDGYPLGIWRWVFKLPKAKALGVLSAGTVLYEKTVSETQKEKFLHGIHGNGTLSSEIELGRASKHRNWIFRGKHWPPNKMPELTLPSIFDMNGSIPIQNGRRTLHPYESYGLALEALKESWESIPQVTFDFLVNQEKIDWLPINVAGTGYQLELDRPHEPCVGRIGVIQEPELKARIVANPNRILQCTLDPLKDIFMMTAHRLDTDCTFDQEAGIHWVQTKLQEGVELAGSDLTSASDLLNVQSCSSLVTRYFGLDSIQGYDEHLKYFLEVSRSKWYCPFLKRDVAWEQGDPLGTGPSFGLLTLTNNVAAMLAWSRGPIIQDMNGHAVTYKDCFRVIGDDIIMRAELQPYYEDVIKELGGEINHSKTLKSNKVAEFAGRIILPDQVLLKRIKFCEPSDSNFMSYMSQLGDQAKFFMRPRQRQVYHFFKEVPGIVVDGPWMKDSYGESLTDRYQWYLEEVEPVLHDELDPDLDLQSLEYALLVATLDLEARGKVIDTERELSWPMNEDYLSSQHTKRFKSGGDPRLSHGKTTLEVLESAIQSGRIRSYSDWISQTSGRTPKGSFRADPLVEKQPVRVKGRDLIR